MGGHHMRYRLGKQLVPVLIVLLCGWVPRVSSALTSSLPPTRHPGIQRHAVSSSSPSSTSSSSSSSPSSSSSLGSGAVVGIIIGAIFLSIVVFLAVAIARGKRGAAHAAFAAQQLSISYIPLDTDSSSSSSAAAAEATNETTSCPKEKPPEMVGTKDLGAFIV